MDILPGTDIESPVDAVVTPAQKKIVLTLGLLVLFCSGLIEATMTYYHLPHPGWALLLQLAAVAIGLVGLGRVRSPRTLTIWIAVEIAVVAGTFAAHVALTPHM